MRSLLFVLVCGIASAQPPSSVATGLSGPNYQTAVNAWLQYLYTGKASLASPTFTGTVSGITATMVGLGNVTNDAQTKAAIVPNTVPGSGKILVGNGVGYSPVNVSGDCTLASTGAMSCGGSASITDFATTKTSGLIVSVAAGSYRYGTNFVHLSGALTFTLQTVSIVSIVAGVTTSINTSSPMTNLVNGQSINVQLAGTGPGCAAGNGVFVATALSTTLLSIPADTSAGCTGVSGLVGAQTGGAAIIFGNTAGQVEMSISAGMGALVSVSGSGAVVSQTATGTFPNGSIPIASISVTAGAWDTVTDKRAFLSNLAVQSGNGIDVTMVGGQVQVGVASNVPLVDALSTWVNAVVMKDATKTLPWRTGSGSPDARDNCQDLGEAYFRRDTPAIYTCSVVGTPGTWTAVAYLANPVFTGSVTDAGALTLSGTITPTALSGNVNDYNPAGCSTALALRIDGGAADRNITGLACGTPADGRMIEFVNIGTTNNLVIVNQSSSSTAANRFLFPNDVTLPPNTALVARYDGTTARWRSWNRALANTGITPGTYESVTVDAAGRVTAGSSSLLGTGALQFTFDTTAGTCSITSGTGSCSASATAGNGSVPGVVVTHNFGSTVVWPSLTDSSRIASGSSSPVASASVLGWITDAPGNITTITLSGALAGKGAVSSGGSGPAGAAGAAGTNGTNGAGYKGTSVTSTATGTGSKTVTTQTGLAYVVGDCAQIVSAGTPGDQMIGPVTAYNSGTGSLTITSAARVAATCSGTTGSGTHTDWNISIAGVSGADGAGSGTMTSVTVSAPLSGGTITTSGTIGAGNLPLRIPCIPFGADNASADLVDGDFSQGQQFKVAAPITITEISAVSNGGTPSVPIIQKYSRSTGSWVATDITSGALATGTTETCAATTSTCLSGEAKSGTVSIVTAGSANTLAAGDYIQTKTGSGFASSGAKRVTVCFDGNIL